MLRSFLCGYGFTRLLRCLSHATFAKIFHKFTTIQIFNKDEFILIIQQPILIFNLKIILEL